MAGCREDQTKNNLLLWQLGRLGSSDSYWVSQARFCTDQYCTTSVLLSQKGQQDEALGAVCVHVHAPCLRSVWPVVHRGIYVVYLGSLLEHIFSLTTG